MNFRNFIESIYPFTAHIKNHVGKPVAVYINPTKSELSSLGNRNYGIRALLDKDHCYAWGGDAFHSTIVNYHSHKGRGL